MGTRSRRRFAERAHSEQIRIAVIGVAVAVLVGAATIIATVLVARSSEPQAAVPSVADQWLAVRHKLAGEGWAIVSSRRASLRDDGRSSTILTIRSKDQGCSKARSDQVRFYDLSGGRLKQMFSFEPKGGVDCQSAMAFSILAIGRYQDNDNTRDLIGLFATNDDGPQGIQIPVVISWDPAGEKYELHGLLKSNADLASFGLSTGPLRGTDRSWYVGALNLFLKPFPLSHTVKAWGASNVAFEPHRGDWAPLIAGIFRMTAGNAAPIGETPSRTNDSTPVVYERGVWSLYTDSRGLLMAGNCAVRKRDLAVIGGNRTPDEILAALTRNASDLAPTCDVSPFDP